MKTQRCTCCRHLEMKHKCWKMWWISYKKAWSPDFWPAENIWRRPALLLPYSVPTQNFFSVISDDHKTRQFELGWNFVLIGDGDHPGSLERHMRTSSAVIKASKMRQTLTTQLHTLLQTCSEARQKVAIFLWICSLLALFIILFSTSAISDGSEEPIKAVIIRNNSAPS